MREIIKLLSFQTVRFSVSKSCFCILSLITLVLFISCNNDDHNCQGIDCLPLATQTGEGTFGCLVNGEPFVDNSGSFNCFYQLVDGEYYFGITAQMNRNDYVQIDIGSLKSSIQIDSEIELKEREDGNFYAWLNFSCICPQAKTTTNLPGKIFFTKLDFTDNVISATFEFTVTDPNTGTVYEVTEGRFDAIFTQ